MKTLFYFELRVSAGMIENLKTRDITLIPTTFRSTKMFKNVGIFVPKEMLINTCVEMPIGFTNITNSTARTCKLINNTWFKRIGNKILNSFVVFLKIIVSFVLTRPFGKKIFVCIYRSHKSSSFQASGT